VDDSPENGTIAAMFESSDSEKDQPINKAARRKVLERPQHHKELIDIY
jgi:hypothetical protein